MSYQGYFETINGKKYTWTACPQFLVKLFEAYLDAHPNATYNDLRNEYPDSLIPAKKYSSSPDTETSPSNKMLITKNLWNSNKTQSAFDQFSEIHSIIIDKVEYLVNRNLGAGDIYQIENQLINAGWKVYREDTGSLGTNLAGTDFKAGSPVSASMAAPSSTYFSIETILDEKFKYHKQVILTGAPGTSKTYSVREYVNAKVGNDESRYAFVQFHPSYDYTDFVEGIRPVEMGTPKSMHFERLDGRFKAFCRKIVENNMISIWGSVPSLENDDWKVEYFEKECECDPYYFIIDEINRADLSKVFGELMFVLEESYRSDGVATQYSNLTTYEVVGGTAQEMKNDVFKNKFFIPKNLYIIGTMNDIDRSVEAFDFALRRRFEWIEIKANDVMKSVLESMASKGIIALNSSDIDILVSKAEALNKVISEGRGKLFGLSEAYHIGPAYFKGVSNLNADLEDIFDRNIQSILKEYTRGRDNQAFINDCRDALTK